MFSISTIAVPSSCPANFVRMMVLLNQSKAYPKQDEEVKLATLKDTFSKQAYASNNAAKV